MFQYILTGLDGFVVSLILKLGRYDCFSGRIAIAFRKKLQLRRYYNARTCMHGRRTMISSK